jgi:hypothetical protein
VIKRYTDERATFEKLAQQCSFISRSEGLLYERGVDADPIRFASLTDRKFEEVKLSIMSSEVKSAVLCLIAELMHPPVDKHGV